MAAAPPPVVDFYDRHPISERQVLGALRRAGADLDRLAPEDLYAWDQDHYGGVAAVDALARRAGIRRGDRVLDVCSGLGGPARILAHRHGARVVGVDLPHSRCAGGRRLSRRVGLDRAVHLVNGDAERLPLRSRSFAAVVSEEGLLHVPDKGRALAECARVLASGGRIAFTDWVALAGLGDGERGRLAEWMAAVSLPGVDAYRGLLGQAGFVGVEAEDLSAAWIPILRE